ncbi:hypothetical protein RSAG8_05151, partial [Rhizoctonia solani AG-8 WAC10335]
MMASLDEEFQRWVESKDLGPPDALESDRTSNALAESQGSSSTHNSLCRKFVYGMYPKVLNQGRHQGRKQWNQVSRVDYV